MGFLAVWCQFAMTIFYYPSLLGFVASTLAYVFNPELATSGVWTACVIVVVLLVRRLGLLARHQGRRRPRERRSDHRHPHPGRLPGHCSASSSSGRATRRPRRWTPATCCRPGPGSSSLVLIVNNFLSYSGMEMNAVHVSSLRNPAKEFPKSMFLAMGLVLASSSCPALAISWIVPAEELSLTAGVMQAFDAVFANSASQWLTPIVGIMLVTASLGGMLTWLAGPSKGLLLISRQEGYLPPFLQTAEQERRPAEHPGRQGLVTTVIAPALRVDPRRVQRLLDLLGDHHAGLSDHVPADVRRCGPAAPQAIPTTRAATAHRCWSALCGVGFAASLAALLVGFIPPSQFGCGNAGLYFLIVAGGALGLGLLVPFLFYRFRKPSWKQPDAAAGDGGHEPGMTTNRETADHENATLRVHRRRRRPRSCLMIIGLITFRSAAR